MKKRLLSFVLVLVMVCTLLPFGAFAANSYSNAYDAGEYVRQEFVKRTETISFSAAIPDGSKSGLSDENVIDSFNDALLETVFKHTGKGTEGDYIYSHLESYSYESTYRNMDGTIYVDSTITPVYYTTAAQEKEMTAALQKVENSLKLDGKTAYEKIDAIYSYICDNVSYDYEGRDNGEPLCHTAYAALIKHKAVCQGYAGLLYRMLLDAGIDARIVTGVGNGGNHAWNLICVGDKYYYADVTWDSALPTREYFLRGSKNFDDHAADADSKAACAQYNISATDYVIPDETHVHSYSEKTVKPNCTEKGYTTYTCACGESYKDNYVSALGHSYKNGTCTVCGAKDPNYKQPDNTGKKDPAPEQNNPFVDVNKGSYCYDAVLWAVDKGITNGVDKTHFEPGSYCTRGQIVTFLWRANGCPSVKGMKNPFVDVAKGSYCYEAVLWAVSKGITKGFDATHFKPNDTCTRSQAVTFLWRADGQPSYANTKCPFKDVSKGAFYYDAMMWAVENGITKGVDATHFKPNDTCVRGQIVTFLWRDMT